jgi:hypothetical protein
MKVVGAKTLATISLLFGGLFSAFALDIFAAERLFTLGWGTLIGIGGFGAVVGSSMFRFWNLGEKSRHGFGWMGEESTLWETGGHVLGTGRWRIAVGEYRESVIDLAPRAQHAMCVGIAMLLAFHCMDSRTVDLLDRFLSSISAVTSSYCRDTQQEQVVDDPNAPGCALVRRAYALGYATTLGDCEKKKVTKEGPEKICTLRQRDEPALHYSWRLLDGFVGKLQQTAAPQYFASFKREIDERLDHLDALRGTTRQVLATVPRASHHIWTNLPDPGDGAFEEITCVDRYRWLSHGPTPGEGEQRASKVFEHILGQLLFESRYEPAAGYCREYHVHWGAPDDVCARLAANPDAVLAEFGADKDVRDVLARHRYGKDLEALGARKVSGELSAFLSFQCYIETDTESHKAGELMFDGQRFAVDEVRVARLPAGSRVYADRYEAVAKMLLRGFHYGALLSEAGTEQDDTSAFQAAFHGSDFLLLRVFELESFDIYRGPGWMVERPDLLEIYPYQRHLKNFVQMFRRQYGLERGRL